MIKDAQRALTRAVYELLITPIRVAAKEKGYAIAVHGSLARDIDLIAAPWTDEASSPQDLIEAILEAVKTYADGEGYLEYRDKGSAENLTGVKKPHGRRAWTIHVEGTYFDISVMPRRKKP